MRTGVFIPSGIHQGGGASPVPTEFLILPGYGEAVFSDNELHLLDSASTGTQPTMQPGRAASFDGADDYYQAALASAVTYPFTISAWIYRTNNTGNNAILSVASPSSTARRVVAYLLAGNDQLYVERSNDVSTITTATGLTVTSAAWHHIAVVFLSATELRAYVDGIEAVFTGVTSVTLDSQFTHVQPALRATSLTYYWNGRKWDDRIYDRVLTAAEIAAIYTDPTHNMYADDLIAHWPLEESVASSPAYETIGQKHGTKYNGVAVYSGADVPGSFANDAGWSANENLCQYSEDFNGSWVHSGVTITGGQSDPFGGTGASLFEATGGSSANYLSTISTLTIPSTVTCSVYVKSPPSGTSRLGCLFRDVTAGTNIAQLYINGSTGAIEIFANYDGHTSTTSITDAGNGWWRIAITCDNIVPGANKQLRVYIFSSGATLGGTEKGLYFGVQINRSGVPAGYNKTQGATNEQPIPLNPTYLALDAYGNDATYSGRAPRNALVTASNCLSFDGVDDYLPISAPMTSAGTSYTFRVVMSSTATGTNRFIFDGNGSARLAIGFLAGTANKIGFYQITAWQEFGNAPNDGNWHDIVFVFDGNTSLATLYIDGVSQGTKPYIPALLGAYTTQVFLRHNVASNYFYLGKCSNIAVYDGALSSTDVSNLLEGIEPSVSQLVRLTLSEGAGTIAYDSSGNGRHGTLTGGPTWTTDTVRPDNLLDGFSLYGHATLADMRVPYDSSGTPLSITPQSGYSLTSEHPAGPWHNAAESTIDFTDATLAPWTDKIFGGYTLLNGSSQYFTQTSHGLFSNQQWTIFGRGYTTALHTGTLIWAGTDVNSQNSTYLIAIGVDGKLSVTIGNGTSAQVIKSSNTISTSTWFSFCVVRIGSTLRVYVDGVETEDELTLAPIAPPTPTNWRIGAHLTSELFNGRMQDVMVFNEALSLSDVVRLHSRINIGPDPESHWRFNRGHSLDLRGYRHAVGVGTPTFPKKTVPTAYPFGSSAYVDVLSKRVVSAVREDQFRIFQGIGS